MFSIPFQFFETVVRYDRFFSIQSQHIPAVLVRVLDWTWFYNEEM